MSKDNPFDVWITPYALEKLNQYATAAQPNEVGGLARLSFDGRNVFVTDVRIFPQSAHGSYFEIKEADITAFTLELVKAGRQDELVEWCSIVHSHPVGMSANMSSVDVDAIKRYASEEDAFSLIISASHNASSRNLLMHYCTNIRGEKFIVSDMPVSIAYSSDRMTLADDLTEWTTAEATKRGVVLSKHDLEQVADAARVFAHENLPQVFSADRAKLKATAESEVKKHQSQLLPARTIANTNTFGYNMPTAYGWYDDDVYDLGTEQQKRRDHEDLVKLAGGVNPVSGAKDVSKQAQKRARKRLEKLADRERNRIHTAADGIHATRTIDTVAAIQVGDWVIANDLHAMDKMIDMCESPEEEIELIALQAVPAPVQGFEDGALMVSGFYFWPNELRHATSTEIAQVPTANLEEK